MVSYYARQEIKGLFSDYSRLFYKLACSINSSYSCYILIIP